MRLEDYIQQETERLIKKLAASAPADICPCCCVGEGRLTYNGEAFRYQCELCGAFWPADALQIDKVGNFEILEWAD